MPSSFTVEFHRIRPRGAAIALPPISAVRLRVFTPVVAMPLAAVESKSELKGGVVVK